ncbi:MAG TPA: FmdB family zinc ribbon protein [Zeimonas sp.]
MPIYAYRCAACGAEKDVLQKFSDAPLAVCPVCAAESFHRVLTAPAFQLKGSGWYVTDFRDRNKPKPGAPASKEPASADGSKASGSDAAVAGSGGAKTDGPAKAAGSPAPTAGAAAPGSGND